MTSPYADAAGGPPEDHIDLDELAEAAEGLLDSTRQQQIDAHLAGCARCSADARALTEMQHTLAAAPPEQMPAEVFARLQDVVATEQQQRVPVGGRPAGSDPGSAASTRYAEEHYSPGDQDSPAGSLDRSTKPVLAAHYSDLTSEAPKQQGLRAKFAAGAVAASVLAATAGFGGYVASAAAGTDEPPLDSPVVVSVDDFAEAATRLWQTNLDAYRFTQAWSCARKVTDGRITGIEAGVLSGQQGYVVFVDQPGGSRAVFVTGCDTSTPVAGPSVPLPER